MVKILALSMLMALAASLPSRAGESGCCAEPGCAAANGCGCGCSDGLCCPRCGCHEGLVPVCHPYMDTKTVTKYKYCCLCEDKCIPGKDCSCGFDLHLGCHEGCGDCGCKESCGCESCGCGCDHCKVREIKKLVKIPYKETVCVRKCWVEWVCPKCNCCCNAEGAPAGCTENNNAAPAAAPMPPAPPAPPANAAKSAVSDLPPVPAGANMPY